MTPETYLRRNRRYDQVIYRDWFDGVSLHRIAHIQFDFYSWRQEGFTNSVKCGRNEFLGKIAHMHRTMWASSYHRSPLYNPSNFYRTTGFAFSPIRSK